MTEHWLPVVGWEGIYEVSDLGRVKSVARQHPHLGGVRNVSEKILSQGRAPGSMVVVLSRPGQRFTAKVHRLVLEAFVGPCPPGYIARHWPDRDVSNNALVNLEWNTQSQNMFDRRAHGTDHESRKTHCPQGHEYTAENTRWSKSGSRNCRACQRDSDRRYRTKKKIIT